LSIASKRENVLAKIYGKEVANKKTSRGMNDIVAECTVYLSHDLDDQLLQLVVESPVEISRVTQTVLFLAPLASFIEMLHS
jgi:hypothetical protein